MTVREWKEMLANSAWVECMIVFIIFVEFLKKMLGNFLRMQKMKKQKGKIKSLHFKKKSYNINIEYRKTGILEVLPLAF